MDGEPASHGPAGGRVAHSFPRVMAPDFRMPHFAGGQMVHASGACTGRRTVSLHEEESAEAIAPARAFDVLAASEAVLGEVLEGEPARH